MTKLRLPLGARIYHTLSGLKEIREPLDFEGRISDTCSTIDNSFEVDMESTMLKSPTISIIEEGKDKYNLFKNCDQKKKSKMTVALLPSKLDITAQLGRGAQGTVLLATDPCTKNKYAIKISEKNPKTRKSKYEDICREAQILESISHPFLLKFYEFYEDKKSTLLLLEFCQGGDMFHHLNKVKSEGKKGFSENTAKFYIAGIILALEELHDKGVIYRDLKPENVLIDNEGYPKLCDFGLGFYTKDINLSTGRKQGGSREYFSPEVVRRTLYDSTVDWWGLGILAYELLYGNTPFANDNIFNQQNSIRNDEVNFTNDVGISHEGKDLIQSLLIKDRKARLGAKGVQEIKNHPWFQDIDWEKLSSKQVSPSYDPKVSEKPETYYFDTPDLNIATDLVSYLLK